ncbi:MAG: carbohydrate ABC transporter permease [Cyanobacteria bacterium]|nr:carbohydrate ABC transporter permease [Cyanobacteriota bacterium]
MFINSIRSKTDYLLSPLSFPNTFTLENIVNTVLKNKFLIYIGNSFLLTSFSTAVGILLACLAAYSFAKMKFKGSKNLFIFTIALMSIPPMTVVVPLFGLMVKVHLINNYLSAIIIYIAFILPFSILFITNFFKSIPNELVESAYIDGCSDLRILFKIFIPIAKAPILTIFVVNALWVWNDLLISLIFLQSEKMKTLTVVIAQLSGRNVSNPTMIFAGLVISTIPILILYLFAQKSFISGVTSGSFR